MYNSHGDFDRKLPELLRKAMLDEKRNYMKYKTMAEMTDNKEIIEQIRYAYEDEANHFNMFREIYEEQTGKSIQIAAPEQEQIKRLIDAVKSSIEAELEAVELYRDIRARLKGKKYRDMLYEIITDEQEHATRFVYLYSMLR